MGFVTITNDDGTEEQVHTSNFEPLNVEPPKFTCSGTAFGNSAKENDREVVCQIGRKRLGGYMATQRKQMNLHLDYKSPFDHTAVEKAGERLMQFDRPPIRRPNPCDRFFRTLNEPFPITRMHMLSVLALAFCAGVVLGGLL